MKIHEYNQMMSYLTRPKDILSKEEKKEVVKDFYKKVEQPKSKPMPIIKYIDRMNRLYGSTGGTVEDPGYIDPKEMEDIKKSLPVSEMVKQPKKKIIKVAKKELPKDWQPKYLNGNVIDITPLIDDNWFEIFGEEVPKEESRLLLVPKSKAEGIETILNLYKKRV